MTSATECIGKKNAPKCVCVRSGDCDKISLPEKSYEGCKLHATKLVVLEDHKWSLDGRECMRLVLKSIEVLVECGEVAACDVKTLLISEVEQVIDPTLSFCGWLVGLLGVFCLVCCLLVGCFCCLLVGCFCCFIGWLFDWFVGWLFDL